MVTEGQVVCTILGDGMHVSIVIRPITLSPMRGLNFLVGVTISVVHRAAIILPRVFKEALISVCFLFMGRLVDKTSLLGPSVLWEEIVDGSVVILMGVQALVGFGLTSLCKMALSPMAGCGVISTQRKVLVGQSSEGGSVAIEVIRGLLFVGGHKH